jgi:hypothetical protein
MVARLGLRKYRRKSGWYKIPISNIKVYFSQISKYSEKPKGGPKDVFFKIQLNPGDLVTVYKAKVINS